MNGLELYFYKAFDCYMLELDRENQKLTVGIERVTK